MIMTLLFSLAWAAVPELVWATNTVGDKTTTLTVNLNDNGSVKTAAVLTIDDLKNMTQHQYTYSTVNNNTNVFFYATEGVLISDILARAKIDPAEVDRLKFTATDGYTRTLTEQYLMAQRYYYPNLANNYATQGGIQVQPILALKSQEVSDQSQLDLSKADDYYSARLFFGQTDQDLISDKNYVKWVNEIDIYTKPLNSQVPTLAADTENTMAGQPITLTFSDDQAWRGAITDVTVDGNSISGQYSVGAGTISIDGSVLTRAKDYTIVVKANGYQDAVVIQHKGSWPELLTIDGDAVTTHSFTALELRTLPSTVIQFGTETCKGVALKDLLTSLNINDPSWQAQIRVSDEATFHIDPVSLASLLDPANKYLLTYDLNGQPITVGPDNQTPLRLYWGLGVVYKNVTGITISKTSGTGTAGGQYALSPAADASYYSIGETTDGIPTMTVNPGISGLKYFTVNVSPIQAHNGNETVVFVLLRDGRQLDITAAKADFDSVNTAVAGFNVQAGDLVKTFIVDDLTHGTELNPQVLQ